MSKILIVDYLGQCDKNGKPIGHALKTIEQYGLLLEENNTLDLMVSDNYINNLDRKYFSKIYLLKNTNRVDNYGLKVKFSGMLGKMKNLHRITQMKGYDFILFINIDFLLGIFSKKLAARSTFLTISYMDEYKFGLTVVKKIKNHLFNKIFKYSNGNLTSNKIMVSKRKNTLLVPDFIYIPELYDRYVTDQKDDCFLCIGTLSDEKDIEGIVKVFLNRKEKLKIIGKFYNEDLFNTLNKIKTQNITIENRLLEYREYYKLISKSKFIILPYKEEFYDGRSSGVLLETIFFNNIPIAPNFLLKNNNINGISYNSNEELSKKIDDISNRKLNIVNNVEAYKLDYNKKNLSNFIESLN